MRNLTGCIVVLLACSWTPSAVFGQVNARISDVAKFKGPRVNRLQGIGLVVGLAGTGDGDSYKQTMQPLASWLKNYANPVVQLEDLKNTKNVALVTIHAELPEGGAREGDRLDVHVSAMGACKSLAGGRLLSAPLQHHSLIDKTIIGFAMGPLELTVPDASKVNAIVRGGLILEEDAMVSFLASGTDLLSDFGMHGSWLKAGQMYVTLVIHATHEGFGMASAIAHAVNQELGETFRDTQLAMSMDPKNVVVRVPEVYADDPVPFLYEIEKLTILLPEKSARIVINRAKQIIALDGEVTISPTIFTVKGLTISITRDAEGQIQPPATDEQSFIGVDPGNQSGAALSALLQQLNQIRVPINDRIAVIEALHSMGNIHAEIIYKE
ncbi:MAG: flagellar basal body P-ring protein FlgI [Planctomycetes bacterium]|nr:flagellar basal body P-ring protein FlgI [Planctomycetota bacterium]